MDNKEKLLEIKNLSINYSTDNGVVKAVQDLDLRLGYGETLGFVGETGAGKTTTALGIMQLVAEPPGKIVSGEIIFEGQDLLKKSKKEMRSIRGNKIAMIFQDPMTSLDPVVPVGEQIAEMVRLHEPMSKKDSMKKAEQMLETVGIRKERVNDYPHQFSGGMKQRVVIAIALACNPSLLIADEPTTALDVCIQAQILNLMNKLQKQLGLTYLFISHNLSVVKHVSDRIAVMYLGKMVELSDYKSMFVDPLHPYTQALLSAIPIPKADAQRERIILEGDVPSPVNPPDGCRFYGRCMYRKDVCKQQTPDLKEVEKGRFVACHFAGNLSK